MLLGSKNPSKLRSLEMALKELGINDFEVYTFDVESDVPSKPIGFEIIRGAQNRNRKCIELAKEKKIKFDYVCGLEGGYSIDENGIPFVTTYAVVETANGKRSTGKSACVRLTREMFDFIREGGSPNKIISKYTNSVNKTDLGFMGFLTNGLLKRDNVDKDAIITAFIPFIFKKQYDLFTEIINATEIEER